MRIWHRQNQIQGIRKPDSNQTNHIKTRPIQARLKSNASQIQPRCQPCADQKYTRYAKKPNENTHRVHPDATHKLLGCVVGIVFVFQFVYSEVERPLIRELQSCEARHEADAAVLISQVEQLQGLLAGQIKAFPYFTTDLFQSLHHRTDSHLISIQNCLRCFNTNGLFWGPHTRPTNDKNHPAPNSDNDPHPSLGVLYP